MRMIGNVLGIDDDNTSGPHGSNIRHSEIPKSSNLIE